MSTEAAKSINEGYPISRFIPMELFKNLEQRVQLWILMSSELLKHVTDTENSSEVNRRSRYIQECNGASVGTSQG